MPVDTELQNSITNAVACFLTTKPVAPGGIEASAAKDLLDKIARETRSSPLQVLADADAALTHAGSAKSLGFQWGPFASHVEAVRIRENPCGVRP